MPPLTHSGVPRHVAIIMDGNGRWAGRRGLPRTLGHRKGVESVRRIVRHAGNRGVGVLTLYAFSRENWNRPKAEVSELMGLLQRYIRSDLEELVEQGVRVQVIGGRHDLNSTLLGMIENAEARTAHNDRMHLVLAFNYGGRDEIVRAARRAAEAVARGELAVEALDEARFAGFLDTGTLPDPDLVIRTSGEQRISNFLLWQSAYAEYSFPDALWPDFDEAMFDEALRDFAGRERRFGTVPPVTSVST
ncbi:isoprenyl transferase [Acuticoccus sp. MNP-M23]|uniref:isoprenyl transferase n=1 Tax=Acuticoccus sp. MNP-M23 TaxID=3072793 RepID=UPI002815EF87|nr:isoprenyl transferase [Acuticoccus sp. MNP-M23]WMS41181.1 isoprenyl transferase [Acuticoccus sp. MNP-M23]